MERVTRINKSYGWRKKLASVYNTLSEAYLIPAPISTQTDPSGRLSRSNVRRSSYSAWEMLFAWGTGTCRAYPRTNVRAAIRERFALDWWFLVHWGGMGMSCAVVDCTGRRMHCLLSKRACRPARTRLMGCLMGVICADILFYTIFTTCNSTVRSISFRLNYEHFCLHLLQTTKLEASS